MSIFEEYFSALGIRGPIQRRILEVLETIKKIYPNERFVDVSINEFLDEEGVRHLKDIRFYSSNISVHAKDFLIKNDFYISSLMQDFLTLNVESKNYDFVQANEKSKLDIVGFMLARKVPTELHGSGVNCDYLFDIFKKYFLPRLTQPR